MRYEVQRGYVIREGALLTKGSVFNAPENEVVTELRKGIIVPVKKSAADKPEKAEVKTDES